MKIGKLLSLVVAGMLVATSVAPAAYADPGNNNGNNKNKSALSNSQFKDIDSEDLNWAKDSILRMADKGFLKGYGNGFFQPNKPVTQLEAVTMALRVAGEEPKAISYADLISLGKKNFKFKNLIGLWAEGYVDLAVEEGILDESDIKNLNSPAKRCEVAKYMVRALGLEDDAVDNMDADLDFIDDENVPDGYEGYVYVALDEGLMTVFPNGMFLPNKPVTRAEMSIILDRIDEGTGYGTDYERFTGEVVDIDRQDREITLEISSSDRTFDLASTVYVMFDDKKGTLSDIEIGDDVRITVNADDKVIRIDVDRALEEQDTYSGKVLALDENEMTLLVKGVEKTFDVDNNVDVVFDDRDGTVDDVIKGDSVKIYLDSDDNVIRIVLSRDYENFGTYDGEVTYVDSDEITIMDGSTERNFDFDSSVQVFFDDYEMGDVEDIEDGDDVVLIVNEDDDVVTVTVDRQLEEVDTYNGRVLDIDNNEIKLLVGGSEKTYDVDDNVDVVFDDRDGDVEDVIKGDWVKIYVDSDDYVIKIELSRDYENFNTYDGEVTYVDSDEITIMDGSTERNFDFDSNVQVFFTDDEIGKVKDIDDGDDVELIVNEDDNVVTVIVDREL